MVSTVCSFMFILCITAVGIIVSATTPTTLRGKKIFDVRSFGARGDGKTDNTNAFMNTWIKACHFKGNSIVHVYVPFGTFSLGGVTFIGPCKNPIIFNIKGTLLAPKDPNFIRQKTWIIFRYVDYLTVTGGGILDGQGSYSWRLNNCRKTSNCRPLPMNMDFSFVRFSSINNIKSINSKMGHFNFFSVQYFEIASVSIIAPEDSPNTDGIKIGSSHHMKIHNVNIGTGDDCIAILSGTSNLDIYNVRCGPGHGISVGSLGRFNGEKGIQGITVRDSIFNGTMNGVRIKTWPMSGPPNLVSNFQYENLHMINVLNPINIDQQYCPNPPCSSKSFSRIQIQNVKLSNVWGTSTSKVAVKLQCSEIVHCKDIELININLVHHGPDGPAMALCENVHGSTRGNISPRSCIH